ncbi:CPK8 [Symbiodinium pilosum]|uniref:CPK8 protein n=1 Tax=Symbiodinium pilosum TaxID=2952 RepID=A0A812Q3W4_SYMPI|nr:CPK8 [Symbiodinium pilosum]
MATVARLSVLLLLSAHADAAVHSGYIYDRLCIGRGVGIDGVDGRVEPQRHTVHCNLVSICRDSGYGILTKPSGSSQWSFEVLMSDRGNADVITWLNTQEYWGTDVRVEISGDYDSQGQLHVDTIKRLNSGVVWQGSGSGGATTSTTTTTPSTTPGTSTTTTTTTTKRTTTTTTAATTTTTPGPSSTTSTTTPDSTSTASTSTTTPAPTTSTTSTSQSGPAATTTTTTPDSASTTSASTTTPAPTTSTTSTARSQPGPTVGPTTSAAGETKLALTSLLLSSALLFLG